MQFGLPGHASATWHLFRVSLERLVRSRQTMVSLLLMGFASLAVIAWTLHRNRSPADFTEQVFLTLYASVLMPIFCLSYGTAGIASDREERTLVYLLCRAAAPRAGVLRQGRCFSGAGAGLDPGRTVAP